MELRHNTAQAYRSCPFPLNRTYVELRLYCKANLTITFFALNRTYVELRQLIIVNSRMINKSLNRTYVELRLSHADLLFAFSTTLNRTYVELRPLAGAQRNADGTLSIVPMWN